MDGPNPPREGRPDNDAVSSVPGDNLHLSRNVSTNNASTNNVSTNNNTVKIDGSYGEGGGQLLRMSLILSSITGKSFFMENIRSKRKRPGLRRQHLGCVELATRMTNAKISKAVEGSTELFYEPGKVQPGIFDIDIGAGSITLLLSVFMPIAMTGNDASALRVTGGTDVPFSPTFRYFTHAFLPNISDRFTQLDFSVQKSGFYPRGGGVVTARVRGNDNIDPFSLVDKGECVRPSVQVLNSNLPDHIPERIIFAFRAEIDRASPKGNLNFASSVDGRTSPDKWRVGVSVTSVMEFEEGIIAVSGCGKRGLPSEKLGRELAREMIWEMEQPCVDSHLADQLLPYLALFGGSISVRRPSEHFQTALHVIEQFLGRHHSMERMGDIERYAFQARGPHRSLPMFP